jgi:hypothetical protein
VDRYWRGLAGIFRPQHKRLCPRLTQRTGGSTNKRRPACRAPLGVCMTIFAADSLSSPAGPTGVCGVCERGGRPVFYGAQCPWVVYSNTNQPMLARARVFYGPVGDGPYPVGYAYIPQTKKGHPRGGPVRLWQPQLGAA